MTKSLFGWRSAALGMAIAAAAAAPAVADSTVPPVPAQAAAPARHARTVTPTTPSQSSAATAPSDRAGAAAPSQGHAHAGSGTSTVDTSKCAQASFSQPFAPFGDFGFYTLMPGQAVDNFAGTGWTLTGGASIATAKLRDGSTGSVLNLPGGSSATSPLMCVSSNYPTARTMIRDVKGSSGVQFYVSYQGTKTWVKPRNTGLVHGNSKAWTLSHRFYLQPNRHTVGWQIVRFRLSAARHRGDYQLYNIYVDPHMWR
jgi:hypothetical protein